MRFRYREMRCDIDVLFLLDAEIRLGGGLPNARQEPFAHGSSVEFAAMRSTYFAGEMRHLLHQRCFVGPICRGDQVHRSVAGLNP